MFLASDSTLRPTFDSSSKLFLNLGKIQITWYAVIILGGAIICSLIAYYRYLKRMGMSIDTLSEGLAFGLLFGILGARLYYVAASHGMERSHKHGMENTFNLILGYLNI